RIAPRAHAGETRGATRARRSTAAAGGPLRDAASSRRDRAVPRRSRRRRATSGARARRRPKENARAPRRGSGRGHGAPGRACRDPDRSGHRGPTLVDLARDPPTDPRAHPFAPLDAHLRELAPSPGVIIPKYRGDLLASAAITEGMFAGAVEPLRYPRNPLDIVAQQVVAMTAMDDWGVDDLERVVRQAAPFAELPRSAFEGVLD